MQAPTIIVPKTGDTVSKEDFVFAVKNLTTSKPIYHFEAQVKPPANIEPKVGDKVVITTTTANSTQPSSETITLDKNAIESFKSDGYFSFYRIPAGSGRHTISAKFLDKNEKPLTDTATKDVDVKLTPTKPEVKTIATNDGAELAIKLPSLAEKEEATEYVVVKYTDNDNTSKTVVLAKTDDKYIPVAAEEKDGETVPVF